MFELLMDIIEYGKGSRREGKMGPRRKGKRGVDQLEFFGITIIIMKSILIIREGRILLDEAVEHERKLSLKVCVGTNIHKYDNLTWNELCSRWETSKEIKVAWLELYYPSRSIPKVVGEATIESHVLSSHLEQELKIALTYDGMIKGWLYCLVGEEGHLAKHSNEKYLYIHKINLFFLEDCENELTLAIFQNQTPIYEKRFIPALNSKTLFPNLRNSIRYSDVIRIILLSPQHQFNPIPILIDKVKRGKTTYFQTWIRNKYNNKAGDIRLQYFLQNLYLDNERKVLSRKPVFPHTLSRMSTLITENMQNMQSEINTEKTHSPNKTQRLQSINSVTKERIEEMSEQESQSANEKEMSTCEGTREGRGRSTKLIKTLFNGNSSKINEKAIPCLKKSKTLLKVVRKQRNNFYFECPME